MKEKFTNWLLNRNYAQSTSDDYPKRIEYVLKSENLNSWKELADHIDYYVGIYSPDGIKGEEGMKSHNAVISALRRFNEFVKEEF